MILKLKLAKDVQEKALLREGEFLIVKSLKGDNIYLTKPSEKGANKSSILEIVGIGKSRSKNVSVNHDAILYPSRKTKKK